MARRQGDPEKDHNWNVLAKLLKARCRACREVCPKAKIIIHTEHAQDWAATKGYYERLSKYKVDYDVIGLSYYPMWHLEPSLISARCSMP